MDETRYFEVMVRYHMYGIVRGAHAFILREDLLPVKIHDARSLHHRSRAHNRLKEEE